MPHHAAVLQDRGSVENRSVDGSSGDPSIGSESGYNSRGGGGGANWNGSAGGGVGGGSRQSSNVGVQKVVAVKGKQQLQQPRELRSPDGRHTPVKDMNVEVRLMRLQLVTLLLCFRHW